MPSIVTILDSSGVRQAFFRMENAPMISYELSPLKAYSALAFGAPTGEVAKNLPKDDPVLISSLPNAPKITLIGGGFPIVVAETLIGAIGASGGTVEQDEEVAQAGFAGLNG